MNPGSQGMPDFCNRRYPFHYGAALNTLTKLGVDINKVDLIAVGEFENYKGEILGQDPEPGTPLGEHVKITLRVGFPSAVDCMPYQFFYGVQRIADSTGSWEDQARAVMAPFDAAVVRHEATAEFESLKSSFGFIDYAHLKRFLKLFNFSSDENAADLDEMLVWSAVFPGFHLWAGNAELVCRVLKTLFGFGFDIVENVRLENEIPEDCRYKLGSEKDPLGKGTILGRRFSDLDSGYEVIISGVRPKEAADLLPGGRTRRKIERALEIAMPNHLDYTIRVKTTRQSVKIGNASGECYLGYSSHV
ncbi:MAG: type VI secretion system baseplate subunit TssG [candidate division Zixibacteria bacterium]|nr:type VI secretion system baseplate subunit TssG [candidate division Zixibacteria bacterium]